MENASSDKSMSRNAFRRAKKKKQKLKTQDISVNADIQESASATEDLAFEKADNVADYINEYDEAKDTPIVLAQVEVDETDPIFAEFKSVFKAFDSMTQGEIAVKENRGEIYYSEDEEDNYGQEERPNMSISKLRRLKRPTVAQLKQEVDRPDLVEWFDTASPDPRLLIALKTTKNSVPIPEHWSQKRGYLGNKRGVEKLPFQVPDFIRNTGVLELRSAAKEREPETLRGKMRERVRPRLGKLDIDYQKLHDAFFRFQTKCAMLTFGDMYYEGKEHESNVRRRRPGDLSDELKEALGMPENAPPPWLINMQRHGPPPSYPGLKIPGLNAPIPAGAQWGYHPGGWGKPPVDEFNRPLYGDVFGVSQIANRSIPKTKGVTIEREHWGDFDPTLEEEDESEEESENGIEAFDQNEKFDGSAISPDGLQTPSGLYTTSGIISEATIGIETPEKIELRKHTSPEPKGDLYKVLPQQQRRIEGFMGSQHGYEYAIDDQRKRKTDNVQGTDGNLENDIGEMISNQAEQASKKRQRQEKIQKKEKIQF